MKRIALLAAALAAGCVSSAPPPPPVYYGDVVVYWNFQRNTFAGPVIYDASLTGVGTVCDESGVEYVTVTDAGGAPIDPYMPTINCVYNGVQGATFRTFPQGNHTFVVHGYRGAVEVHRGQGSVDVNPNMSNPLTITAVGVQANLVVYATLDAGAGVYPTCGDAGVQRFDFWLEDFAGTLVDTGSVPCGPLDTPGIAVGLADLDDYFLWLYAVRTTPPPDTDIWAGCRMPFSHFSASPVTVAPPYQASCAPLPP